MEYPTDDQEERHSSFRRFYKLMEEREPQGDISSEIKVIIRDVDFSSEKNIVSTFELLIARCDLKGFEFFQKYLNEIEAGNYCTKPLLRSATNVWANIKNIISLLEERKSRKVQVKYVHEYNVKEITNEKIDSHKACENFRILKLTNCFSISSALKIIHNKNLKSSFHDTPYLFVVILKGHFNDALLSAEDQTILKSLFPYERPIVLQIFPSNSKQVIYFKEEKSYSFYEVLAIRNTGVPENLFSKEVSETNYKNSLVKALLSNLNKSSVDTSIELCLLDISDGKTTKRTLSKSNSLCARFFMLFDRNIATKEWRRKATIQALNKKRIETIFALIDLPFNQKVEELKLNDDQRFLIYQEDQRGRNLLEASIELGYKDKVRLFSKLLPFRSIKASNLCWKLEKYDCLFELIDEEYCFPLDFDIKLLESFPELHEKFNAIIKEKNLFHELISTGKKEELKKEILRNPDMKNVYDSKNQSALFTALKCRNFKIYVFLRSEGFNEGEDENVASFLKNLTYKQKSEIAEVTKEYFKNAQNELFLSLTSKSKPVLRENFKQIHEMYEELLKVVGALSLMKAVAFSKELLVAFDFTREFVDVMDPRAEESTKGLSYFNKGYILIGAKNYENEPNEVLGTIAHEMAHYALNLVYENQCLPYKKNHPDESLFGTIVDTVRKKCEEDENVDPIVSSVFDRYPEDSWHQELIVRVPQLMTKHRNSQEELNKSRISFPTLFDFYQSKVEPFIKDSVQNIKSKFKVKDLNEKIGDISFIHKDLEFERKTMEEHLDNFSNDKLKVFSSKTPTLLNTLTYKTLEFRDKHGFTSKNIFRQIKTFSDPLVLTEFNSELQPKLVIDCTSTYEKCHMDDLIKFLNEINNDERIILVLKNDVDLRGFKREFFAVEKELSFTDLNKETQDNLKQIRVRFQGSTLTLNELGVVKSLEFLPLEDFLTNSSFEIETSVPIEMSPDDHACYIQRSFKAKQAIDRKEVFLKGLHIYDPMTSSYNEKDVLSKRSKFKTMDDDEDEYSYIKKSFHEILDDAKENKIMIISDAAGTGKTETLMSVANELHKQDPSRWISLFDLKNYVTSFKTNQDIKLSFSKYFASVFLNKSTRFEQELFMEMFVNGKAIILFDGFDEISPKYKDKVLSVLKLFKTGSGNQLWVTTRSHLREELETSLGQTSISFEPLTREEQVKIFSSKIKGKNKSNLSSDEFVKVMAQRFLNKLPSISIIGVPLLVSILAEEQELEMSNPNLYSIYKGIVRKKIQDLTSKGPIATEIINRALLSRPRHMSILEIHEKLALKILFHPNDLEELKINCQTDQKRWDHETISKFGIFQVNSDGEISEMQHVTFKEYFVAEFIINKIKERDYSEEGLNLLAKIMMEKKFEIVRKFLDDWLEFVWKYLSGEKIEKIERFANEFAGTLKMNGKRVYSEILLNILQESHASLVKFTLQSLTQSGEETRKNVFRTRFGNESVEDGDYALHLAIRFNTQDTIERLCEVFKETFREQELKKELKRCGKNGRNIFHCCLTNRDIPLDIPTFSIVWDIFKNDLNNAEIEEFMKGKDKCGDNVFHFLFLRNNEPAWEALAKLLKTSEFLSTNQLTNILNEPNLYESKPIHLAILFQNKSLIKSLCEIIKTKLEPEEQRRIFTSVGYEKKNIYYY